MKFYPHIRMPHHLTYNLLWAPTTSTSISEFDPSSQSDSPAVQVDAKLSLLSNALSTVLANPAVLPVGGTLGFHLLHEYSLERASRKNSRSTCKGILPMLKGSDRTLYRACAQHLYVSQLDIQLHYYVPGVGKFLCDSVIESTRRHGRDPATRSRTKRCSRRYGRTGRWCSS